MWQRIFRSTSGYCEFNLTQAKEIAALPTLKLYRPLVRCYYPRDDRISSTFIKKTA